MRPEGGTEPGVEHVGCSRCNRVAGQRHPRRRSSSWRRCSHCRMRLVALPGHVVAAGKRPLKVRLGGGFAVPDRNLMSPPKLPADGPVALFAEPVEIALGIALGMIFTRPSLTASMADWASSSIFTNH